MYAIRSYYGRPGFGSILRQLSQAWKEKPSDIEKSANNFLDTLKKTETLQTPAKLEKILLDEAAMNLFQMGDFSYGGVITSYSIHYTKLYENRNFCL